MKKTLLTIMILVAFIISGCQSEPGVYARIGENEISKDSFNQYMLLTKISYDLSQAEMPQSGEGLETLKKNILDNMVEGAILVESAGKLGIEIDEEQALQEAESLLEMVLESYGEDDYQKLLDEYRIDRNDFEDFVKKLSADNQMIYALYERVTEGVEASEEEAYRHYEENIRVYNYSTVHAKGFVFTASNTGEEVRAKLESDEMSMDEAIEAYREDENVLYADDFGPLYFTDMSEDFAEELFDAGIGDFTRLVESEGLYYLGYVYSRDDMEPAAFEDVESTVYERVLSIKRNEAYEEFFIQEKESYEIEVYYDKL